MVTSCLWIWLKIKSPPFKGCLWIMGRSSISLPSSLTFSECLLEAFFVRILLLSELLVTRESFLNLYLSGRSEETSLKCLGMHRLFWSEGFMNPFQTSGDFLAAVKYELILMPTSLWLIFYLSIGSLEWFCLWEIFLGFSTKNSMGWSKSRALLNLNSESEPLLKVWGLWTLEVGRLWRVYAVSNWDPFDKVSVWTFPRLLPLSWDSIFLVIIRRLSFWQGLE